MMLATYFLIARGADRTLKDELKSCGMTFLITPWLMGGFVCDWVLAVAADNMTGVPTGENKEFLAIYISYLFAVLVPLANR